jgi:hypothetical protein
MRSSAGPGRLWLKGDVQSFPVDWTFADKYQTIMIETHPWYLIPHSVNIFFIEAAVTPRALFYAVLKKWVGERQTESATCAALIGHLKEQ